MLRQVPALSCLVSVEMQCFHIAAGMKRAKEAPSVPTHGRSEAYIGSVDAFFKQSVA